MDNTIAKKPAIQSVERAIWILNCFKERDELSLTEISTLVGLHKSTTYGLLSTLEAYRLVEQDQRTGKYSLGVELLRLGRRVKYDLRQVVSPFLDELVAMSGETANLMVLRGYHVVYLDKRESPHSMRISTYAGMNAPAYRTAGGKAILSCYSDDEVRRILEGVTFERPTRNSTANIDELLGQLAVYRQDGFSYENGEYEDGISCIAVAIVNSEGRPVCALSISGPTIRMSEEKIDACSKKLMACAAELRDRIV